MQTSLDQESLVRNIAFALLSVSVLAGILGCCSCSFLHIDRYALPTAVACIAGASMVAFFSDHRSRGAVRHSRVFWALGYGCYTSAACAFVEYGDSIGTFLTALVPLVLAILCAIAFMLDGPIAQQTRVDGLHQPVVP